MLGYGAMLDGHTTPCTRCICCGQWRRVLESSEKGGLNCKGRSGLQGTVWTPARRRMDGLPDRSFRAYVRATFLHLEIQFVVRGGVYCNRTRQRVQVAGA